MADDPAERLHILILSDRDWTHPQGGGTGTNLFGQVSRWLAWGHRVTVISCAYPGAKPVERIGDLTLHRMGGRSTVFPRVIFKQWRGLVPDADVVLEVVNGITFLTPLWLRTPRVTLVHHIHREHYAEEMGWPGRLAAFALETAPLRFLYRTSRFLTISKASADDIAAHSIPRDQVDVGYIGVEAQAFAPDESKRAAEPTLLYLGRLKRYKRIEVVLDALEASPGAVLDLAGGGDHREALEADIAARGLGERVRMHGHVSEQRKRELYQHAWVNLTASSAEGWCLTVMEAAACATPTVALAVGGLPESIEDGRTGVLARDADDLGQKTRMLLGDHERRRAMGRAALERAREFTWDATARRTLDVLEDERERAAERPTLLRTLAGTDTGRAAGLAAALMANNFLALVVTIAFARLLGASGYGSLGALLAAFAILMVPGSALQATVAREVSAEAADGSSDPARGVRSWLRRLLLATVAATGASLLLRDATAAAIGVEEEYAWAAGAVVPTAFLWLVLCVQRGALQGLRRYRVVGQSIVGEAAGRLVLGVALVAAGLGVTGAFVASTLAVAVVCLALVPSLSHALGPARASGGAEPPFSYLLSRAWAPVLAFSLIAVLQNIDIVIVKHAADDDAAGSYAAASVAAKAVIWVAIGLGLYLLPEAVRRTRAGQDARPVLARTIALIAAISLPTIALYAVAAEPILSAVFGPDLTEASGALPLLAIAMALLACGYLAVQYLLALGRVSFVVILGLAAALELVLLATVGAHLTQVALVVAALQLALAAVLGLAVRSARRQALAPA